MAALDPRTTQLADPKLPALGILLGGGVPEPLQLAASTLGDEIVSAEPIQVTWRPGTSVTVRYRATTRNYSRAESDQFVAISGRIPKGAIRVARKGVAIGVWRVPHDPALPGLASALDGARASELLADLGASSAEVTTRLRAYRPGRRAVVEVAGSAHSIYLKLVRPGRVEELHRHHRRLASHLPVPHAFGFARDLGIVALQTLPGMTLRAALEDPGAALPDPSHLLGLLGNLPTPDASLPTNPSPIERAPEVATLLRCLVPALAPRLARLLDLLGEDRDERVPVHGDFYEAQLMVESGLISGLLDLDTVGWGRRADDLATMIGHLSLWQTLSSQPERVRQYGQSLLRLADRFLDPADTRRRVAAVVLSLATGPFRVLLPNWPEETAKRIDLADRWAGSAYRVGKTHLMHASRRSHLQTAG